MSATIPEPVPSRPWRPEDGPRPQVWTWPPTDRPVLEVWLAGAWRTARVLARQNWADGSTHYQVQMSLLGDEAVTIRKYRWPQPGLRAAHASGSQPSTSVDVEQRRNTPQVGRHRGA
ncbi:MAG TPA: hypothetical protein VFH94_08840 [Streptomyces sp.]|nr:hypothetical protein [Streptomyces sp.]